MEVANPVMVAVAREARMWTQSQLAAAASVSQGYISKVESGVLDLTGERLTQLAEALEVPEALLLSRERVQGLEVSCLFHRRRSSRITVAAAKRTEAIGHLTRLSVHGLESRPVAPELERMDVDLYGSPEAVARAFRARWRVPSGPISNVASLLDDAGVAVITRDVGGNGQDAFSTWPAGERPLMVVNRGLSIDRWRFTVSHELGHVLMHLLPNDQQESQANAFAGEFLMPRDDIRDDLAGLTTSQFTRLMDLKVRWRVSIGALIHRARTLDVITERQFKEFRIRLSRMGWNVSEPVELTPEVPTLVPRMISRRLEAGESFEQVAAVALMKPDAFRHHFLVPSGITEGTGTTR